MNCNNFGILSRFLIMLNSANEYLCTLILCHVHGLLRLQLDAQQQQQQQQQKQQQQNGRYMFVGCRYFLWIWFIPWKITGLPRSPVLCLGGCHKWNSWNIYTRLVYTFAYPAALWVYIRPIRTVHIQLFMAYHLTNVMLWNICTG